MQKNVSEEGPTSVELIESCQLCAEDAQFENF